MGAQFDETDKNTPNEFQIVDEPFYNTFLDAGYFLSIDPELKS